MRKKLRLGGIQIRGEARKEIKARVKAGFWARTIFDGTIRAYKGRPQFHSWSGALVHRVGEDEILIQDNRTSTLYTIVSISKLRALLNDAKQLPIQKEIVLGTGVGTAEEAIEAYRAKYRARS